MFLAQVILSKSEIVSVRYANYFIKKQVAKCYPDDMAIYPQKLIDLLRLHSTVIDPDMRMSLCRALVLLRHKGLLDLTDLLQVSILKIKF